MSRAVLLESSTRQSDEPPVLLDGAEWGRLCDVGRRYGYGPTDEVVLPAVDARLLADALRRGSADLGGVPAGKVQRVLALLDAGGVMVTRRQA